MNTLILNPSTILGFTATVITCTGIGLKNPYVAFTGFNLGMSAGIVNTSNKKSKDKQTQQLNSQINFLTNQIKDIENQTQEQHQISSQYQQTLQELKSQQKQALEQVDNNTIQLNFLDPCKLNFKLNNRERQLDQHNKKLKRYQHELNSQKANQNRIFSQIQKSNNEIQRLNNEIQRLNNEQKESCTIKAQQLNEIEKQGDKLINNIQKNLIESNIQFSEDLSNAITEPIDNEPNTIVYIDGNNLYNCLAKIGIEVDYESLLIELYETINAAQIKIYDGAFPNQKNKYSELRNMGYQVFTFPIVQREGNVYKTVGDDVQMAIDMVQEVKSGDRVFLITGDGDFYPALKEIKQRNVHITVIAENQSISHYLKELSDEFISLNSFEYKIAKHTRVYAYTD